MELQQEGRKQRSHQTMAHDFPSIRPQGKTFSQSAKR